jgi:predicted patatin/cPLA2 family phospholipase
MNITDMENELKKKDILLEQRNNEIREKDMEIQKLQERIKVITWKSYNDRWEEIYKFFNKNGIRQTAKKFDMPIKDVMDFIVECDDNICGLQDAFDYKECNLEVYGKDEDYCEEDS